MLTVSSNGNPIMYSNYIVIKDTKKLNIWIEMLLTRQNEQGLQHSPEVW